MHNRHRPIQGPQRATSCENGTNRFQSVDAGNFQSIGVINSIDVSTLELGLSCPCAGYCMSVSSHTHRGNLATHAQTLRMACYKPRKSGREALGFLVSFGSFPKARA